MVSLAFRKRLEPTNIKYTVLLVLAFFVILTISACSPYTSGSKVTTPMTPKQCYLVLPPDEVQYLFLLNLSSKTPDEYASLAVNIFSSSTVKDIGRGDWLIVASYHGTFGIWKLTQEPSLEFTFSREDRGAQYIEDSVLNSLWDRPNLSDISVFSRGSHYRTVRRTIDAYRAVLLAATAEANGNKQADYLRGRANGLSSGIKLRYEVCVMP